MKNLFKNPWWIVVASLAGGMAASGPIALFTFGVFLKPITHDFGWTRGMVASALLAQQITSAIGAPIAGNLIDRFGIRRVMLPATIAYALATAMISQTSASPFVFILLYGIWGALSMGQGPLPYGKAISAWFDARRGLALGIAISGIGLGGALMPQIARLLIAHFGWRHAYVGLGIVVFVLVFPAIAVVGRKPEQQEEGAVRDSLPRVPATASGMTLKEAVGSASFWLMAATALLVGAAVQGTIQHTVPLLTDRGLSLKFATSVLSMAGLSMIVGRTLDGYLLDRFFAPYVAACVFQLPMIGILLLISGWAGIAPFAAIVCLGLGAGAEIGLLAFLVGRYFGLRSYAQIYGYMMMAFMFGSGLGPWFMGICFDKTRSYNIALAFFACIMIISGFLISRLGPYVYAQVGTAKRPKTLAAMGANS